MLKFENLKKKSFLAAASFFVLLFAVLLGSALSASAILHWAQKPVRSGYYAVFLSNGQAYFGTVGDEDDKRLVLNNIYYIQKNPEGETQNDMTLLKLGNELHGPEDMMEINKNQVMFLEKLKSDGKVMQAIQNYKK